MQCIQCGYCVSECPKGSLVMEQKYTEPQVEKVIDVVDIQSKKPEKNEVEAAPDANLTCNKDACVFCGLCAKACPADALKVDRKEKIWEVDDELCAKCGVCVEKCPKKCLSFGQQKADEKSSPLNRKVLQNPNLNMKLIKLPKGSPTVRVKRHLYPLKIPESQRMMQVKLRKKPLPATKMNVYSADFVQKYALPKP